MARPAIRSQRTQVLAEQLYREHHKYLLNVARANGAKDRAEDAVASVFAQFLARFDPDGEHKPLGWLVTATKYEAWGELRRYRKRAMHELERGVLDETGEARDLEGLLVDRTRRDPVERLLDSEEVSQIEAALGQLKPHERECLLLKAAGYRYKEIQALKGWSRTKVNRLMVEGRARLRELVLDED